MSTSTSFSTLENISLLFNQLINSNRDALSLNYISKLLNDLTKLLIETDYYDVEIKVGEGLDVKTFKVHSTILKVRSSYFKAAFSNSWIKKSGDGSVILFEKKNISPKVFEVILM